MGQIKFITSLVFLTIFAIAIISYAVGFANDNTVYTDISDDSDYAGLNTQLKAQADEARVEMDSSSQSFANSTIESGDEVFSRGGVFKKAGQNSTLEGVKTIINTVNDKIFGGKGSGFGIVIGSFIFILGFIFVVYVYKTWVGKNPD